MPELLADEVVTENHQDLEKKAPTDKGPKKKEGKVQAKPVTSKAPVEPYKPKISFPQRLKPNISDL